jgi:hypothetical protein
VRGQEGEDGSDHVPGQVEDGWGMQPRVGGRGVGVGGVWRDRQSHLMLRDVQVEIIKREVLQVSSTSLRDAGLVAP